MTNADFLAWHKRMGYTYTTGSAALGVTRQTYANYLGGLHHVTKKPTVYGRTLALACRALEQGLQPLAEATHSAA